MQFIRISEPVTTPKKTLEGSSEGFSEHRWSCFRDLQLRPLQGSYLTIEVTLAQHTILISTRYQCTSNPLVIAL